MKIPRLALTATAAAALVLAATGCSTPAASSSSSTPAGGSAVSTTPPTAGGAQAAKPAANTRIVKSRDGRFEGEIVGTPAASSRFAKLQIGMDMSETQNVLGRAPDRLHSYESGKRWIPFYFGNDARRMQVLYKGEGCLIFTGGNVWGGGGGELIQIEADPSGNCYQP